MLNGNPATFQVFTLGPPALIILPSSLDGPPPPEGTPAFFAPHVDGDLWGGEDRVEVYALHVDWGVPANSTFTSSATLGVAGFSSDLCSGTNLFDKCVPQPGSAGTLETLPHWAMGRLQYRNFDTHESMVFNHTVDVEETITPESAGMSYAEPHQGLACGRSFSRQPIRPMPGIPASPTIPTAGWEALQWTSRATWPSVTVPPAVRYSPAFPTSAVWSATPWA